jgi:hypothetical protein
MKAKIAGEIVCPICRGSQRLADYIEKINKLTGEVKTYERLKPCLCRGKVVIDLAKLCEHNRKMRKKNPGRWDRKKNKKT